jgi:aspartate ammonia-lyase
MGHARGEYKFLHPNDDVNMSQSTNDTYPTAAKLAIVMGLKEALKSMDELKGALQAKAAEFKDVIKMGRTEMQDAVPVTLGQEFSGFADTVNEAMNQLGQARDAFMKVNLGGTAIGTGINSPPGIALLRSKSWLNLPVSPLSRHRISWVRHRIAPVTFRCRAP